MMKNERKWGKKQKNVKKRGKAEKVKNGIKSIKMKEWKKSRKI